MDLNDYQRAAMRTAKDLGTRGDLTHAALGLCGEAGEFADAVKKYTVYDKSLDVPNCLEEIGDILWFCALACETLGVTLSQVALGNISKLTKRYPGAYSDVLAQARLDKAT